MDVMTLLKKYRYPIVGGLLGLIFAVLLVTYGLFKTILILVFIALGIYLAIFIERRDILDNLFKK
ncbi:DUF2273 domain-containing protein [Streptococcus saliviloxodontae]|uniref:Membrane protein n=2 Tax=Streptococcus saliviloxodontae TaxID=1349416 RepID=A0ABS2PJH5_9STRE|nr:putative membrane protein [Streptococcus saliviloxodontae]